MDDSLLDVKNLVKEYRVSLGGFVHRRRAKIRAVDDVSFSVRKGETLALIGESGCGKTTLSRCLTRLVEPTSGFIRFKDKNVRELNWSELRKLRAQMQIIYQDPFSSLNPRKKIMDIVAEPLIVHRVGTRNQVRPTVMGLLEDVGLGRAFLNAYPQELSGGERQRVNIARALAISPEFVIADEPVSALDVSIQAQVLNVILELQVKYGLTYLFISHDLRIVEHIADRIAVMYLGRIMELGEAERIFENASHPYTKALIRSIPPASAGKRRKPVLSGEIPSALNPPGGCAFHPRCNEKNESCHLQIPEFREVEPGHLVACSL
jgi:oligopeptide/dipeptide ABC transporter ATP-binding protein